MHFANRPLRVNAGLLKVTRATPGQSVRFGVGILEWLTPPLVASSLRSPRMRAVLRRPDFRLLLAGVVAAMIGDSALVLALAIWMKQLTDSNALAGLAILTVVAP